MDIKRVSKILWLLFACVFLGLIAITVATFPLAKAEDAKQHLQVSPNDLTVEKAESDGGVYFRFTVNYDGANESGLPQYGMFKYSLKDQEVSTDRGKIMFACLQPESNSTTQVHFYFYDTDAYEYPLFSQVNPSRITIPKEWVFDASSRYMQNVGEFLGIEFTHDIVFVKEGTSWKIERVAEEITKKTEMTLDKDAVSSMVWNTEKNRLEAEILLPYSYTEDLLYEGVFSFTVQGAEYLGNVLVAHLANTNKMALYFEDSESLAKGIGISVTLSGGTFYNRFVGKLVLSGEVVLYGCSDGVWSTVKYKEVHKDVQGVKSIEKIDGNATEYTLTTPTVTAGNMFLGWYYDSKLYKATDTLSLAGLDMIALQAKSFAYGLEEGASIRYDQSKENASGLRFIANLTKESFECVKNVVLGVGVIVMPTDLIEANKPFIWTNYNGENGAQRAYIETADITFDDEGKFSLYATIAKVLQSNYNRDFSARAFAYVRYSDYYDFVWAEESEIVSRSVYEVASKALQAQGVTYEKWQKDILEAYVNSVVNVVCEDMSNVTIISAVSSPVIESASIYVSEGIVYLVLKTQVRSFVAVTFNGVRIRGGGQTYDESAGTLTVSFWETLIKTS